MLIQIETDCVVCKRPVRVPKGTGDGPVTCHRCVRRAEKARKRAAQYQTTGSTK